MSLAPNSNQFFPNPVRGGLALSPNLNIFDVEIDENDDAEYVAGQPVDLRPFTLSNTTIIVKFVTSLTDSVFGFVVDDTRASSFSVASRKKHFRVALEGGIMYMESSSVIPRGSQVRLTVDLIINPKISNEGSGSIIGIALDRAAGANELIRVFINTPREIFFAS